MSSLTTDLRHAWRRLLHRPGFTLAAVLMLALGIGACVVMASVLRGVVLASLPYPGGEQLVAVAAHNPRQDDASGRLTMAEATALAADAETFAAFGYYDWAGTTVLDGGRPREISLVFASAGFFDALGVAPLLGRTFRAADMDDAERVAVLSHAEWQRLSGGDPALVGGSIDTVGEGRLRVIGVMPPDFAYPIADIGLWRPFRTARLDASQPGFRNARFLDAVGRFADAETPAAGLARAQATVDAVREGHGQRDLGWRLTAVSLHDEAVGGARPALWASFAVALLVLLIACGNVALLLDARQIARRHQDAVAQAIGASRGRLLRTLLLELGLIGALAAAAGALLAALALHLLRGLATGSLPRSEGIVLDAPVLAFALVVGLATPLLAGLLGSLRLRSQPIDAMRSAGDKGALAGAGRTRLLPVVGVALSTVGLVAAAAMTLSLVRMLQVDPGFRADGVHAVQLFRNGGPAEWAAFAAAVRTEMAAVPGVRQVAVTSAAPLSNIGNLRLDLRHPGGDDSRPIQASVRRVSAGYLDVVGVPLLAGRDIADSDRAGGESVAVISASLARRAFGDADPIGQQVSLPLGAAGWVALRVVGVSADLHNDGLRRPPVPEVLVAFDQHPWVGMTFVVQARAAVAGLPASLREALWRVDAQQATTREFALADDLAEQLLPARFHARTLGAFALCALLLAAFGIHALARQQQAQRRAEFGLRLAIGAAPGRLARSTLLDSLRGALLGIVAGALVGVLLVRALAAQLAGFGSGYLPWLALTAAVMLLAVLLAALRPALAVARMSPMAALRHD